MRRAQRRCRSCFGEKFRPSLGIVLIGGWEKLNRNLPPEPGVFRKVDLSHPAGPELFHYAVVGNSLGDHQWLTSAGLVGWTQNIVPGALLLIANRRSPDGVFSSCISTTE